VNYGELKTELLDIAKVSASSPVGARVAKFVTRAEGMIARRVRALELVTRGTLGESDRVSAGLYNLPTGCLDVIFLRSTVAGSRALDRRSIVDLSRYGTSLDPHSYAPSGSAGAMQAEFRGVPANGSSFDILYFKRPTAFAAAGDTNALLTAHESLYIYAGLHWLYIDAQALDKATAHKQAFEADASDINRQAREAIRSGAVAMEYAHGQLGGPM
jgi:hypothetical protein